MVNCGLGSDGRLPLQSSNYYFKCLNACFVKIPIIPMQKEIRKQNPHFSGFEGPLPRPTYLQFTTKTKLCTARNSWLHFARLHLRHGILETGIPRESPLAIALPRKIED